MRTSFKLHLAVLALGLAMPSGAFALEAGTREVPAKEIAVPTADVSPKEQVLIGSFVFTTSFHTAIASSIAAGYGKSGGMR
jgi:hypothetical protein